MLTISYYNIYRFRTSLLSNGDRDFSDRTPLHLIAGASKYRENKIEILKLLLSTGANPNAKETNGDLALHTAAKLGDLETCKELLSRGADVNCGGKDGWTALHVSSLSHESLGLVKLLLSYGADPNRVDNKGFSPLDLLKFTGKGDTKKLLVSQGAVFHHFHVEEDEKPILWKVQSELPKSTTVKLGPVKQLDVDLFGRLMITTSVDPVWTVVHWTGQIPMIGEFVQLGFL